MADPRPTRRTAVRPRRRLVTGLAASVLAVSVLAATALGAPAAGALSPPAPSVAAALRDPGPSIGRQIDAAVEAYLRATGISGAQLRVIYPGGAHHTAYGSDGSGAPVTVDDRGGLASITKTFTSALVLRAVDQGVIDLDAPLPALAALPTFPVHLGITPRHLLMHQSGLAPYRDAPAYQAAPASIATPRAAVEAALGVPLAFEPGARTAYSSTNFLVLGFLLEQSTGRSYDDLLRGDLLVPLGLGGVTHSPPAPGEPNFATAGIVASADETARWFHALVVDNDVDLSPASFELLRIVTGPDRFTGGGLWGYCPCETGWSGVGHSGSWGIVEAWTDDRVTIAFAATEQIWDPASRYSSSESLLVELHRIVIAGGRIPAGGVLRIRVGTPNTTVIGNLTATEPTTAGYATAYPCAAGLPPTSNINFTAGQTVANLIVATTDANGELCITPSTTTHLIYDLAATTPTITPQPPTRLADSR
jgi:CubicO group peptidase (beta-lactamase class C family)